MQIVIDIDEEDYERLKEYKKAPFRSLTSRAYEAIANGTPLPKAGHWIEHPEIETSTPEYLMFYGCSECGDRQCFCKSDIHKKRFCSNCGCRMVEPQESEEV